MSSKYKRGKQIRSISDYEVSTKLNNQKMFWINCGRGQNGYVRHVGWIESWQYSLLKRFIENGYVYEAILRRDDDET